MAWRDLFPRERLCSLCERKSPETESRRESNWDFDRPRSMFRWLCRGCYERIAHFILEQPKDVLSAFWKVGIGTEGLSASPLESVKVPPTPMEEWDPESKSWRTFEFDPASRAGAGFEIGRLLDKGDGEAALFHAATMIRQAADSPDFTQIDVELCLAVLLDPRLARPELLEKLRAKLFVD